MHAMMVGALLLMAIYDSQVVILACPTPTPTPPGRLLEEDVDLRRPSSFSDYINPSIYIYIYIAELS